MLMTIDVGNTNTVFGVFDDNESLVFNMRVETNASRMADEYTVLLEALAALEREAASDAPRAVLAMIAEKTGEAPRRPGTKMPC